MRAVSMNKRSTCGRRIGQKAEGRLVRLGLIVAFIACLGPACRLNPVPQQFEEGFVYSPIMRLAANPDDVIPGFAWADLACETLIGTETDTQTRGRPGGGRPARAGVGGGGGGCPT